jgi:plasmid maintenance system antidote protein VapI
MNDNDKNLHPLEIYLKKRHISKVGFSSDLGISTISLNNMLRRRKKPSLSMAVMIEKLTSGQIPCNVWVNLEEFGEKRVRENIERELKRKEKSVVALR